MWDVSSSTRDGICNPCSWRWSLNSWTAREVPSLFVNVFPTIKSTHFEGHGLLNFGHAHNCLPPPLSKYKVPHPKKVPLCPSIVGLHPRLLKFVAVVVQTEVHLSWISSWGWTFWIIWQAYLQFYKILPCCFSKCQYCFSFLPAMCVNSTCSISFPALHIIHLFKLQSSRWVISSLWLHLHFPNDCCCCRPKIASVVSDSVRPDPIDSNND